MSSPPPSSASSGETEVKRMKYGRVSSIKDAPASRLQIATTSKLMVLHKSAQVSSFDSTKKNTKSFAFESLPPNVFEELLKKLSFKEKLNLRNASKTLLQMVDSRKIDIDFVKVEVNENGVEFEIDGLKCKYVAMDYGCRVVVAEDKSKKFPKQDAWIMAKKDLQRLLNLTSRIEKIILVASRHTEVFFKDLVETLVVHKAEIETYSIPRVLLLLSMLDPCHLREVKLQCVSGKGIESIFETAHFRMASSWEISGCCEDVHLEHFWNFQKFNIEIPSPVTLPMVQKVIEKMLANPNLTSCTISSLQGVAIWEIALALGETVTHGKVRHLIPIPGEDRELKIGMKIDYLKARKVEITDVLGDETSSSSIVVHFEDSSSVSSWNSTSELSMLSEGESEVSDDSVIVMDDTLFHPEPVSLKIEENVLTYRPEDDLRNTWKTHLQMVDSRKIDIDKVSIEVTEIGVKYEMDDYKCEYMAMDYGCQVVVGSKSTEFPMEYAWKMAKKDLVELLKVIGRIRKIQLTALRHTDFFFENLSKTLTVHEAEIWTDSIPRQLFLLSMLDPCHLRKVKLDGGTEKRVERIFATAHFGMASSWMMRGGGTIEVVHLDKFWKFEHFSAKIPSVTCQLVLKIKEKLLANSNVVSCRLFSIEDIGLSEIGRALGEIVTNGQVRHTIPIPGDNRDLKIVLSLRYLEAEKISKVDMDTVVASNVATSSIVSSNL
ncbi:unnamed protein product [Caenorhabditis nigoni]